jgi:hypothetical protein
MRNTCTVEGCDTVNYGHGYCNKHYKRWRKTGDPLSVSRVYRVGCSVPECPEEHCALGFCNTHYARFKVSGEAPTTAIKRAGGTKEPCSRRFCEEPASTRGMCHRHYAKGRLYETYAEGFTWEHYDELWDKQQGRCAICSGELVWDAKNTHVDHCHDTNVIRGLLCSMCNQGLGSFKDSKELLAQAAAYLG